MHCIVVDDIFDLNTVALVVSGFHFLPSAQL